MYVCARNMVQLSSSTFLWWHILHKATSIRLSGSPTGSSVWEPWSLSAPPFTCTVVVVLTPHHQPPSPASHSLPSLTAMTTTVSYTTIQALTPSKPLPLTTSPTSAKHNVNGCHPFTCIVHTMTLPWAAQLARQLHLPSALLWVQPATLFSIFHHYFKHDNLIKTKLLDDDEDSSDDSVRIGPPGLPPLKRSELPSSIACPSSIHSFVLPLLAEDLRVVQQQQQQPNATVLVNTLDELEADALKVVDDYCFRTIAVGPLVPSILLDGQSQSLSHSTLNGDCMEWLGSKAESSVTYISFGSHSVLSKRQMEEIARGLLKCGRPFLWSIREEKKQEKVEEFREEMEEQGKMIKWCDQVEILSHKSVGCFVSHCGWNSILESMVGGVPVVGIPQWADQPTNAKLVEEVWKTGVKVRVTARRE